MTGRAGRFGGRRGAVGTLRREPDVGGRTRVQPRWRSARLARGAVLVLGGLVLAGCARNAPQDTLEPAGPWARKIDDLFQWPFWIAVAIFVIVEGLILFALFRFRARGRGDDRPPRQIHGNPKLEVSLAVLPTLILAGIAVPTVGLIQDLAERPTGDHLVVEVIGHQWWWEYRYPNGVVTATELHIPTGQDVELRLTSADVIHSFWIPKLNGKRDVIPGRFEFLKVRADRPGVYSGQCVEFCGASHANMRLRAVAHEPAEFAAWLESQSRAAPEPTPGSLAARGKEVFTAQPCFGCHTVKGVSQGRIGPDLTHVASRSTLAGGILRNDAENLAAWLRDPPGEKPGSIMPNLKLSEDDIRALVAYLEMLK